MNIPHGRTFTTNREEPAKGSAPGQTFTRSDCPSPVPDVVHPPASRRYGCHRHRIGGTQRSRVLLALIQPMPMPKRRRPLDERFELTKVPATGELPVAAECGRFLS
jgi:hypothetical protein